MLCEHQDPRQQVGEKTHKLDHRYLQFLRDREVTLDVTALPISSREALGVYGERTETLMNHKFYEALVYIVEAAVRQFLYNLVYSI